MAEQMTESCHALVPYDKEVASHFVEAKVLQPEDQQSMIAFGVTGHGKSSFLNLLLGAEKPIFETSTGGLSGTASKTKETQCFRISMKGKHLAFVDTPGFCDTHTIADNRHQEASLLVKKESHRFRVNITKAFIEAGKKVSAFIFVYRVDSRLSLEMTEQLKFLEAIKFPWDHCILVMTHGDRVFPSELPKEKWHKALDAELAVEGRVSEQLTDLIRKTAPRYMLVDSTCRDKKYHKAVMEQFSGFMKQIVDQRGPYENIHFAFFHGEYNKECHSAYMEAIKDRTSLDELKAATRKDFEQLTLIGRSLIAKQEDFIKCFRSVTDMVDKQTFTPVIAAATGFGVAAIAAGAVATGVGIALIPVTFGSSGFAVAVGIASIAGGATVAAGGLGAATGIPLIKKLKDKAEVKKAQSCLEETVDVGKEFYTQYKSIMEKISGDRIGLEHPNAKHSVFSHLAAIHIHESTDKSEALFETAQELGVFCSLRSKENNPSSQSRSHYTLPVGFSLLASTMDVATTVGTALSATHVSKTSKEIDATLLKECEHALEKEFAAIKTLCITE